MQTAGLTGPVPDFRPFTAFLDARGRLRIASGAEREGLDDLLECLGRLSAGRVPTPVGLDTRALAVETLLNLGEAGAARTMAGTMREPARRWGTPRALGLSRYAHGLTESGVTRVEALGEAVELLGRSPGRLERARAEVALGATLRRGNRRREARAYLRAGLERARTCRAAPLAREAEEEIRAIGARPRTETRTGVDSLTPTERRVAGRAADGAANAQIARALFVSVKTVEMHLSSVYRKLGLTSRNELAGQLAQAAEAG